MPRELFTEDTERRLVRNGHRIVPARGFLPVAKIHSGKVFVWLLTHVEPADPDSVFGLCDLGLGHPELGWVSRRKVEQTHLPGLGAVRAAPEFKSEHPIDVYAYAAKTLNRITENPEHLTTAAAALEIGASPNANCCHKHEVKTTLKAKRHYGRLSYGGWI